MEFPREKLLNKYISIYEKWIAPYKPDFEVAGGTTRYVKFNDAWYGLNPYNKFLITRLINEKNNFPKKPAAKIPKNADPANYVTLKYDADGTLRAACFQEDTYGKGMAFVYVSKQLTIGYKIKSTEDGITTYELFNFECYEYDDKERMISAEEFQGSGSAADDVKINCEYYEYDSGVLSHAWQFKEYQKYPMQITVDLVRKMMPDRIFNPDHIEYCFQRVSDGLSYTCNHYFRKSQTITRTGHVSEEKLSHLAENGNAGLFGTVNIQQ